MDSSDISFPASGSNLLSESPLLNSETGPDGDDLSLSELSLSDRTVTDDGPGQDDAEATRKASSRTREEKLQSDLFILKKLNTSLTLYNEALDSTDSATDVSLRACRCIVLTRMACTAPLETIGGNRHAIE